MHDIPCRVTHATKNYTQQQHKQPKRSDLRSSNRSPIVAAINMCFLRNQPHKQASHKNIHERALCWLAASVAGLYDLLPHAEQRHLKASVHSRSRVYVARQTTTQHNTPQHTHLVFSRSDHGVTRALITPFWSRRVHGPSHTDFT